MTDTATIDELVDRALAGYDDLLALGEEIEDEWSYVNDLATTWRACLEEVRTEQAGRVADAQTAAGIDAAIDEAARIDDPHRAIDWLSTFPQVVLVALEGRP